MYMNLQAELRQKQVMSPALMQNMSVLQMSVDELESYIETLAVENPVIEFTERDLEDKADKQLDLQRKLEWLESGDRQNKIYYQHDYDQDDMKANLSDSRQNEENLESYLLAQVIFDDYPEKMKKLIRYIIFSLDHRGYFSDDIEDIAVRLHCPERAVCEALAIVQKLDPAGVGARNLEECLLLQLHRKSNYSRVTERIIMQYLPLLAKKHYQSIADRLGVGMDKVQKACAEICSFQPKPGSIFSEREQMRYVSPDAVVIKLKDYFEILVNEYQYPRFSINHDYQQMLSVTKDEELKRYLDDKVQQAQWVQNCIAQRTSTLLRVIRAIVEWQNAFFVYGPGHKRPMKLSDVAYELNLSESTVSRALRNKYIQCAFGVFPLNYFLTTVAAKADILEEQKTPEQVKQLIGEIVDGENKKKPLSDQAICKKLEEQNIKISRRTVNKYRLEMNIPDKGGRRTAC